MNFPNSGSGTVLLLSIGAVRHSITAEHLLHSERKSQWLCSVVLFLRFLNLVKNVRDFSPRKTAVGLCSIYADISPAKL
jgi:hypothetical protein